MNVQWILFFNAADEEIDIFSCVDFRTISQFGVGFSEIDIRFASMDDLHTIHKVDVVSFIGSNETKNLKQHTD